MEVGFGFFFFTALGGDFLFVLFFYFFFIYPCAESNFNSPMSI